VSGFPLVVAHIGVVIAGGAPPVDACQALTLDIGPELPEVFADTALAPPMPAGDHRIGDPVRFDQQIRNIGSPLPCAGEGCRCGYGLSGLTDRRHRV